MLSLCVYYVLYAFYTIRVLGCECSVTRLLDSSIIWPFTYNREMEYLEQASSNFFYPFESKHQIHQFLQIVKILCPLKNENRLEVRKWARLISWPKDFQTTCALHIQSLWFTTMKICPKHKICHGRFIFLPNTK